MSNPSGCKKRVKKWTQWRPRRKVGKMEKKSKEVGGQGPEQAKPRGSLRLTTSNIA